MSNQPTLISANRDDNSLTNQMFVQLTDGTNGATINGSGELLVSGTFAIGSEYAEDSVHTTGDSGSYVLNVREDTLAASTSATGDYQSFKSDGVGALWVNISNASLAVTQSGTWTIDSITQDVSIDDGGNSITVDNAGTFAVQVDGDALTALQLIDDIVHVEDTPHTTADSGAFVLGIRNESLVDLTDTQLDYSGVAVTAKGAVYTEILQGGAVNSETNPIFIQEVEEGDNSNNVHDFTTHSAVAKDGTAQVDYTVTGTTFMLRQVRLDASVDGKIELLYGPLAGLVSEWVGFIGSKSGGDATYAPKPAIPVAVTGTGTVRLIVTNYGNADFDLYTTLDGDEIA